MAPALLLVPAALASFILAFGTGVEFMHFTSLQSPLGGIPESDSQMPARDGWLPCRTTASLPPWHGIWDSCFYFLGSTASWQLEDILLIFDYTELMGLKQVYYHVLGLGEPLTLKSPLALSLFSHLHHPACVELLTVLWVVPTLGTDHLLLTLYLGLAHGLDQQDLCYLWAQLQRKLHLLSRPQESEAE
ncbi:hypothetical protein P7K49_003741 [Saguinus oedipus]|uniref:Nurim n=1 Tax=Saguinus oedipus TaxID=9490 RepID=A0ABQ9W5D5_SAGOE|nr:hypothetical protein P7K49_003741 [Saguinus oedipus]